MVDEMKINRLKIILAIAFVAILLTGCKSNEAQLREYVADMNAKAYPKQLDEITWLDSLSVMPGLTVASHYTLERVTKHDFTPEQLEQLRLTLKLQTLGSITSKTDKDAKRFRNAGVTFYLEYKDADGNLILDITITPEEYKEAMKSR